MAEQAQRSVDIRVGGECELTCEVCDCRDRHQNPEQAFRDLQGGGALLTLRGATTANPLARELVKRARRERFQEVVVRTHAHAFAEAEAAREFASLGVDAVIVPIFSQVPAVHDRIAELPGALVRTLRGMRALADAGVGIEFEVPLLPARLQRLEAVIDLAHRAVPTLRRAHVHLPRRNVNSLIAPPPWSEGAPLLAAGLLKCRALGIRVSILRGNGIPLCALREFPELQRTHAFKPNRSLPAPPGSNYVEACDTCKVQGQCPGVADSYRAAHGSRDIVPYAQKPAAMYEQRTTPAHRWDDARRRAARESRMLVLRPTVNCNQDCTFCSANETTKNVWSDRELMFRQIARAARRGIRWLSFSGGEPTLSKDLASFIRVAKRTGIEYVEIITNGVLLDSPAKVKQLVDAGLTNAFVSFHAHDEQLSRWMTQKLGDWERTARAIGLLLDAGVTVTLNHVITAKNYRYLKPFVEFVHARYGGRPDISFAFVTPQYKALENVDLVPRLSDVMPHLRLALHRAVELGQHFTIGSRQGIPPCFLKEFEPWSDIRHRGSEALAEDAPQKVRAPGCNECRYGSLCAGLWKPYVARFGLGELVPVRGEPVGRSGDLPRMLRFEDTPAFLRDLEGERSGKAEAERDIALQARRTQPEPGLQVFQPIRSRPLRLAMLGSGRQARRIAAAIPHVKGLSLDAVASPRAPETALHDFGDCPTYRDAADAIRDMRPEGLVIAAATHAHFELAKLAVEAGVPALVEKPFTRTEEEAEELVRLAREKGALLVPAHNMLYAPGLEHVLRVQDARRVTFARVCPPHAGDAPRSWSRAALSETLYHAVVVLSRACGGGVPEVRDAQWRGASVPERVRVRLAYRAIEAELAFDFDAAGESLTVSARDADGRESTWRRSGREVAITAGGVPIPFEQRGNDVENMLADFEAAVLGRKPAGASPEDALDVMRTTRLVLDAIAAAGAPFERPNAPRHVASRALGAAV